MDVFSGTRTWKKAASSEKKRDFYYGVIGRMAAQWKRNLYWTSEPDQPASAAEWSDQPAYAAEWAWPASFCFRVIWPVISD